MKCRDEIQNGLMVQNITCPQKCVTFEAYGRFNNNIIQLVHAYTRFVDLKRVDAASRYSIVLSDFFKPKMHGYMDFIQLEKTCIFPSWSVEGRKQNRKDCVQLDPLKLYRAANTTSPKQLHIPDDTGLIKAWLLYGAVSETVQRQTTEYISQFHGNYSAVHARFLEGSCTQRHNVQGMSSDICQFKPRYISRMLAKLGHMSHSLIFCTDNQQFSLVTKVVAYTHGVLSKNSNPLLDSLLMILSKRFIGNAVSTMSLNVNEIRDALFHNDAIGVLV